MGRSTGVPPVRIMAETAMLRGHGQDAHATGGHGQDGRATEPGRLARDDSRSAHPLLGSRHGFPPGGPVSQSTPWGVSRRRPPGGRSSTADNATGSRPRLGGMHDVLGGHRPIRSATAVGRRASWASRSAPGRRTGLSLFAVRQEPCLPSHPADFRTVSLIRKCLPAKERVIAR